MSWSKERLAGAVSWHQEGLRLEGTPLWLDATRPRGLGVVSHAHWDHVALHTRTLATSETLKLLGWDTKPGATPLRFRQAATLGDIRVELLPSGHMYGSAQVALEYRGIRVLYSGDLYDRPQRFALPMAAAQCDLLILESTYGTPAHVFPSREDTAARLCDEVQRVVDAVGVPLVLVEGSLGRAQEIMGVLADAGHKLVVSKSIFRWNRKLANLGLAVADCLPYAGRPARGTVLVYPMRSRGLGGLNRLKGLTKIACSGQVGRGAARRLGVDVIVPFVDHADFNALVAIASAAGARKILTVHGYTEELARALCDRGLDAEALEPTAQMSLDI